MDMLPQSVAQTSVPTGPGKRQAAALANTKGSSQIDDEVFKNMMKLILSCSQRTRLHAAAMFQHFRLMTDSDWVTEGKSASQKFNTASEEMRKNKGAEATKDELGVPSAHIFNGFVKVLMINFMTEGQREKANTAMSKWEGGWMCINSHIPVFKIEKMMESKHKRLVIAATLDNPQYVMKTNIEDWTPTDFWLEIKKVMCAGTGNANTKSKAMHGQAPAGDLERKLQQVLDAMGTD